MVRAVKKCFYKWGIWSPANNTNTSLLIADGQCAFKGTITGGRSKE